MKLLTREFSQKEKILLLVLVIIILALCYFRFIYTPIKNQTTEANEKADNLQIDLAIEDAKLEEMRAMKEELDEIEANGSVSYMASYNNAKAEIAFLNDTLADTVSYSLSIANVTRVGTQIRRSISMQFRVADYAQAEEIIKTLETCQYRCLISDISVSGGNYDLSTASDGITVIATATFYETTVGGTADAGLPADESEAAANAEETAE